MIAYYFNIALSYTTGPVQWRTPIAAQGLFIIAQAVWVYGLPESPRWLAKRERHEEALDVIKQLHGKDKTHQDPEVLKQKHEIDEVVRLEGADGPWKFSEIFQSGPFKVRRRFLLVIGECNKKLEVERNETDNN